jgi:hypothetical protein
VSGLTGDLLPSNKDVGRHCPFRIKRYRNTGAWLHSTGGDSVAHKNETLTFLTMCRWFRSIQHVVPPSVQDVTATFSPHRSP